VNGQTYNQTYVDKCTGEVRVVTTMFINNNVIVSFYDQIKTFTPIEVQSGVMKTWLELTYNNNNSLPCPTNQIVQQTIQNTVSQSTSMVLSSTSNTITSPETSSTDTNKSDSSDETNNDSDDESNEESEDDDEKKEKSQNYSPILLASDLTTAQSFDGKFNTIISSGISRSSLSGDKSYGANAMIWSTLDQYAISTNFTKIDLYGGKIKSMHTYGLSSIYVKGNFMYLTSYTLIKPHLKYGTYGINISGVILRSNGIKNKKSINLSTSLVGFWTKPYKHSKKLTISPQLFLMMSPISYNFEMKESMVSKNIGIMIGSSFDYKITNRFGFSLNYRSNINTYSGILVTHNFLIGSRMLL
jgi:hypothetical protein